jgi:ABC-type antimicrobial peptide transport system permease subunit
MAVALAAMGIVGIISHAVLRRTREIGIRISVGARAGQVVGLITRQGIRLVVIGFLLGAAPAYLMAQFVRGIFQFTPEEALPPSGFIAIGILAVVALLASWLPARRAAKIQPIEALNAE